LTHGSYNNKKIDETTTSNSIFEKKSF